MRSVVVFLALIVLVALLGGGPECAGGDYAHAQTPAASSSGSNPVSVLSVPPEKMRDVLADIYRPKPDGRFLSAVAEMHAFLTGEQAAEVGASYSDRRWHLSYRGNTVGALPEYPDFPDFMNLLEDWAKSILARNPVHWGQGPGDSDYREIDALLDGFLAPGVLSALHKIDDLWKDRGPQPAMLAAATRGLVLLLVQSLDSMEIGDQLPAKAVAVLALNKGLTDNKCLRDECLLAYTMDYSNHAAELAKKLSENDPVRLYVQHRDNLLEEMAVSENATRESRYLSLLRMVHRVENLDAIKNWVSVHFRNDSLSLPIMKIWMDLQGFSTIPRLSEVVPRLVVLDVLSDGETLAAGESILGKLRESNYSEAFILAAVKLIDALFEMDTPALFDRFESGLQKVSSTRAGRFLDSKSYRAFFNGYFYSSYYEGGLHYVDSLSSSAAAAEFMSQLPEKATGTGADLRQFLRDLVTSMEGKAKPADLQADLGRLPQLGLPPMVRLLNELSKYLGYGDPNRLNAVKTLMPRLDTRASHRKKLYTIAYSHLLDLKLCEGLAEGLLKINSQKDAWLRVTCAKLNGDVDRLRELLGVDDLKHSIKVGIMANLETQPGIAPEFLIEQYRKLLADYPGQWDVMNGYAKYLEHIGSYEEERSVLNAWLDREVSTLGLERILAQTRIAHSYYREGRYEEGFKVIAPVIESWQAGAMQTGAELLEKMGRRTEAEKLSEAIVGRYPDALHSRTFLARLYWSHGKAGEAAKLLKEAGRQLTIDAWQFTIAPAFAEVFSEKPKEEALAAFSSLKARGFDPFALQRLAFPLARNGLNELAFDISSQLQANGLGNLELLVQSYGYLKQFKGKQQALEWLRSKIPQQMLNPLSMIAFRGKEYELIWDPIGDPGKGKDADFVWVMRAAASLRLGPDSDPHRNALLEHYSGKDGGGLLSGITSYFSGPKDNYDGYYDKLGRYLCGLAAEQEVLKLATEPNRRCEIAYYIALRAQSEGRYADASDWYRVAVETGLIKMGEYRWAYDTLYMWLNKNKNLARLRQEKL